MSPTLNLVTPPSQDLAKPYDPKKSCWFPLKEGGFAEGIIESTEGDKVSGPDNLANASFTYRSL